MRKNSLLADPVWVFGVLTGAGIGTIVTWLVTMLMLPGLCD